MGDFFTCTGAHISSLSIAAEVLGMCADRKDGDYQHPSECSKFVKCSNSMEYVMSCPSELVFNTKIDACDYKANVYCLVPVAENAEFHAKDKKPAVVDLSHLPATAKITQVKLEYVSGSVTCAKGRSGSKWGCNNLPPNTYTKEVSSNCARVSRFRFLIVFSLKNLLKYLKRSIPETHQDSL